MRRLPLRLLKWLRRFGWIRLSRLLCRFRRLWLSGRLRRPGRLLRRSFLPCRPGSLFRRLFLCRTTALGAPVQHHRIQLTA